MPGRVRWPHIAAGSNGWKGRAVAALQLFVMLKSMSTTDKIRWSGEVLGVQPRIRLMRSFDERSHAYMGYVLFMRGDAKGEEREFTVGIGPAAQAKHGFRAGDRVTGIAVPVADARIEPVMFYKSSALQMTHRPAAPRPPAPPWQDAPPGLPVYRERGHRRLAANTWESTCRGCIWGCRMPVELTPDSWKRNEHEYRIETFCYGPKSCALYRAGPTRTVPGRGGMAWEEDDAVEAEYVGHRGPDD